MNISSKSGIVYEINQCVFWVNGECIVLKDFDKNRHTITREVVNKIDFDRYVAGVDWGYEHYGAIVVVGVKDECYYVIEEHAKQHTDIDEWSEIAIKIKAKYGDIPFSVDNAGPE